MYYAENRFEFRIHEYNSDAMLKFSWHCDGPDVITRTFRSPPGDRPNWPNLLVWFQRYHAGRVFNRPAIALHMHAPQYSDKENCVFAVLASMFEAVDMLKSKSWSEVEGYIVSQRPSLIAMDARWAQD